MPNCSNLSRDQLMARKYHTNMYTDEAYAFFTALSNALQNVPRRGIAYYTGTYMCIEREPDGEIVLSFNKNQSSYYYVELRFYRSAFYKKAHEFLNWLGWYGINIMKDRYEKDFIQKNWKRNNTRKFENGIWHYNESQALSNLSISDVYLIYDSLRGRTKRLTTYSAEQKAKILGEPLDPITAELERARRDELAELERLREQKISENTKKYEQLRKELYAEERAEQNNIRQEFQKKIDELNNSVIHLNNVVNF